MSIKKEPIKYKFVVCFATHEYTQYPSGINEKQSMKLDVIEATNIDEAVGIFIRTKITGNCRLGAWRAMKL